MNPNPNTANPNPNPSSIDPYYYSSASSSSNYSYYFSSSSSSSPLYLQNPNSQSSLQPLYNHEFYTEPPTAVAACSTSATIIRPPELSASLSSYPQGHAPELSAYCLDPNAQNWGLQEAVRQYGSDPVAVGGAVAFSVPPNGTQQLAIAHPGSSVWTNLTLRPQENGMWKKHQKKTKITKVVQSAYCEVCKVDCNSKDVLDQHNLGKKHRKNLEKLQAVAAVGSSVSVGSNNAIIGPQENPDNGKALSKPNSKRKAAQPLEDLETKKRKVLEGGAAAEAVRTCVICNVVCNSEKVFSYHLAGQKHAAMLKKHAATTTRVATITRI